MKTERPRPVHAARLPSLAALVVAAALPLGCASAGGGGAGPAPAAGPEAAGEMAGAPAGASADATPTADVFSDVEPAGEEEILFRTGTLWTFDFPPIEHVNERHGLQLDSTWFREARLSTVRYGDVCSAGFVSGEGLVQTNHHCARECIESNSSPGNDLIETGFYAPGRDDELACEGVFLDQLVAISDVTDRVDEAVQGIGDPGEAEAAREEARRAIEEECESESERRCQTVRLYQGARYSLYEFRRYEDVRLVFAPHGDVAFFGGDPDNFTYPRHDLDVSFVRAYVDGEPAETPHHFGWSEDGAGEGEPVFVIGNPGSTDRLKTVAQLRFLRDVSYPRTLENLRSNLETLRRVAERGGERAEMAVRDRIFSIENSLKAIGGFRDALRDSSFMRMKAAVEAGVREDVAARPELRERYGDAWPRIARAMERRRTIVGELDHATTNVNQLLSIAGFIVQYAREQRKPEEERSRQFSGPMFERFRQQLGQELPVDLGEQEESLAAHLREAREALGPDHPLVRELLAGNRPATEAGNIVRNTRLDDAAYRTKLLDGGADAIEGSGDPMIELAAAILDRRQTLQEEDSELQDGVASLEEEIGRAMFALYGTDLSPDATFTLRITDGVVEGYPYNGTKAPYKTNFYSMFGRAASADNEDPWHLPETWWDRREALELSTPLNFVSTTDTHGGNSGSPVINADRKIVGALFDGNIEGLKNNFLFTDEAARSISVHSASVVEALRTVYDADALADELVGEADDTGDDTGGGS